jgi:hypothetical protein
VLVRLKPRPGEKAGRENWLLAEQDDLHFVFSSPFFSLPCGSPCAAVPHRSSVRLSGLQLSLRTVRTKQRQVPREGIIKGTGIQPGLPPQL